MKWNKKGLIFSKDTFNLDWYKKNSMVPTPYMRNGVLRLFVAMCDKDNYGRAGYVDLNPDNPSEILGYSRKPVLDLGETGTFDEHGILPSSLIEEGGRLYMYYCSYQKQLTVPYNIYSGLAVSDDNGDSFKRVMNVPVLDRINNELHQRSAIEIMKCGKKYRIWYTANIGWIDNGIHIVPKYDIKCIESDRLDVWLGEPRPALELKDDEYGLTSPQVFFEDGIYKMVYSIRSISKGYRMGYAESDDGIVFDRQDYKMDIDVSESGFDSEMICYGKLFRHNGKTYLFYCGNHYGMGGIGYAVMEGDKIG